MARLDELLSEIISDEGSRIEAIARFVCRVCLVVGPVFLCLALVFGISTFRFLNRCVAATGTVEDLVQEIHHDSDDNSDTVSYRPVFRYLTADGKAYEIRAQAASNPSPFKVGQTVTVLYEPGEPAAARLKWFWDLWGLALIFGIFGFALTGAGLGTRWIFRRLERRGLSISPGHESQILPLSETQTKISV